MAATINVYNDLCGTRAHAHAAIDICIVLACIQIGAWDASSDVYVYIYIYKYIKHPL